MLILTVAMLCAGLFAGAAIYVSVDRTCCDLLLCRTCPTPRCFGIGSFHGSVTREAYGSTHEVSIVDHDTASESPCHCPFECNQATSGRTDLYSFRPPQESRWQVSLVHYAYHS